MGCQFIFVVETNKACNSDWIYIKDTIEHFYAYNRTKVKLSVVYMDGRGNYNSKKKEKEIQKLISQYSSTSRNDQHQSKVIYCFDCNEYNNNPDDSKFLKDAKKYCDDKGYDFVWFCKDVEQVYIGKKVNDSQKKDVAAKFKEHKQIKEVDVKKLNAENYRINTSNIMTVLNRHQELIRKD